MRIGGIVLTVIGALMVLSSLNLALTQYHLSDSHDLSKFMGAAGVSVALLAAGISMIARSGKA
jgi:hypothetical protein